MVPSLSGVARWGFSVGKRRWPASHVILGALSAGGPEAIGDGPWETRNNFMCHIQMGSNYLEKFTRLKMHVTSQKMIGKRPLRQC
jgi:hypothetical protein